MGLKDELMEQIRKWRLEQEKFEDMIQEAHRRIDELEEKRSEKTNCLELSFS